MSDGDLRSAVFAVPLLLAVLLVGDVTFVSVAFLAGVPLGPGFSYLQNVLLETAPGRLGMLVAAILGLAIAILSGHLSAVVWGLLGFVTGTMAFGYLERRRRPG